MTGITRMNWINWFRKVPDSVVERHYQFLKSVHIQGIFFFLLQMSVHYIAKFIFDFLSFLYLGLYRNY